MSSLLAQFQSLLNIGPVDVISFLSSNSDLALDDQLQVILLDLRHRWKTNNPKSAEEYVEALPDLAKMPSAVMSLAVAEYNARLDSGTRPDLEEFVSRFPDIANQLRNTISHSESRSPISSSLQTLKYEPDLNSEVLLQNRYRLVRELGEGAFGKVYVALDVELRRQVAIKVPNPERFEHAQDVEMYLAEAQIVAGLEHPYIVPVYDMGRTPEGAVFIVSRYIEGETLESRLRSPIAFDESARILKFVAEALQHAHDRRLIHRDVKPANILIETSTQTPFITDFGLAIRDDDYAKQLGFAGTVSFMSPEQARGEGHRLDGRSDIFALGVILYEMLTGERPFQGTTQNEVLRKIISVEPQPPRLIRGDVPVELERISLKALSKRISDRYASTSAFAQDLKAWLQPTEATANVKVIAQKITPRGLRSFTADDAGFFLDLLPGPRNRDGLPASIAFWKERIEQRDPDQAFTVGLLYGPSGCGKSSLVKAGLIPNLSSEVIALYVEATPEETESRLMRQLHKRIPELPTELGLAETAERIRRSEGPKVVLVVDQFEQWLYSHRVDHEGDLVRALRQCDGKRLQAVLMIRDDFYLAAARLMNQIDVPILTDQNFKLVDLFDTEHANRVLVRFGESYDRLPLHATARSPDQNAFIDQVVEGLSENSKVVSVRLSLLADMLKGRDWVPKTLESIGGLDGIGISFLEETFASSRADARHRSHQEAVRGVLRALLPDLGTDIKGSMRSEDELLEATGYANRRQEFGELMRILDGELRLLTPTDPEGHDSQSSSNTSARRYYQLTHDYLVPSLREWLTRKQRETKKGRAELKLAERASVWIANQENKQLPTLVEWFQIRYWTDKKRWTKPEESLMRTAARVNARNWGGSILVVATLTGVIGYLFQQQHLRSQHEKIAVALDSLQKTLGPAVPVNIEKLVEMKLPALIRTELASRYSATTEPQEKLSLAFALASFGQVESDYLISQIDAIEYRDTGNLIEALGHDSVGSIEKLRQASAECSAPELERHKARLALASLAIGDTALPIEACAFDGRTDPGVRTWFIKEFRDWELDRAALPATVKESTSPALRSGICLAVGSINVATLKGADRASWQTLASRWFVDAGDSSTHSASGWLLRAWGLPEPTQTGGDMIVPQREWYVNSNGATMLRIRSGYAYHEDSSMQMIEEFWVSDREVTRGQFEAFMNDRSYSDKPEIWEGVDRSVSPTADHPAQKVSWYDAVLYCNWLSMREGRIPVYERKATHNAWHEIAGSNGYRLLREKEWEYVCRSGAATDYSTGNDKTLLEDYCQMYPSVTAAVCGYKKPNPWGFYDFHGNVWEWCADSFDDAGSLRVNRGGGYQSISTHCRSAFRGSYDPTHRTLDCGFRLALSSSGIP